MPANIGCETKDSTWSTGWTSFAGYFVGSEPHLMIQKEIAGTAKIHPLDWEANLESATKDSTWSEGWSHLDTWEYGGNTYLLHYKGGSNYSGVMKVAELTSGGDTDCCTVSGDYSWGTGWDPHIVTMSNGDDYLFRYQTSTNQVRISALNAGTLGSEVYNDTWSSGLAHFDSLSVNGGTHLFAVDSTGTIQHFVLSNSGVPTNGSTAHSEITTVLTDWDLLQAYTLDGVPMIRVYRTSDGFFTLYTIDSTGVISGPLDSGFEDAGWTSIHHFQTAQP